MNKQQQLPQTQKLLPTTQKLLTLTTILEKTFTPKGSNILISNQQTEEGLILTKQPLEIIQNLKIIHPIQILLKEYLEIMKNEGDCSIFMVVLFSRLLKNSVKILKKGIKINDLKIFLRELKDEIRSIIDKEKLTKDNIADVLSGVISENRVVELLMECLVQIQGNGIKDIKNNLERIKMVEDGGDIRLVKINTGEINDSYMINGLVLEFEPIGIIKSLKPKNETLKTAIFNSPLELNSLETKSTILLTSPQQLLDFDQKEESSINSFFDEIDTDVIVCTQANRKFIEFADKRNIMIIKTKSKYELKRLQKLFGGSILNTVKTPEENEKGKVDEIESKKIGGRTFTEIIKNDSKVCTIVLRESLRQNLEETSRKIENCLKILEKIDLSNKLKTQILMLEGAGKIERKIANSLNLDYKNSKKDVSNFVKESFIEVAGLTDNNDGVFDCYHAKRRAIECAFELLDDVLMCDDFLMKGD